MKIRVFSYFSNRCGIYAVIVPTAALACFGMVWRLVYTKITPSKSAVTWSTLQRMQAYFAYVLLSMLSHHFQLLVRSFVPASLRRRDQANASPIVRSSLLESLCLLWKFVGIFQTVRRAGQTNLVVGLFE